MKTCKQHRQRLYALWIAAALLFFVYGERALYGEPGQKDWTEPVTGMEFVWIPGGYFMMGCV